MSGQAAERIVSLVPSLTEAVAELGAADRLVAVTRYCTHGAPAHAVRLRGTKNPEVGRILDLAPDLVLGNREENRRREVEALRDAGVRVHLTEPRTVAEVGPMLADLAALLGVPERGEALALAVEAARTTAERTRPSPPVAALTLIWRRPWMGVGPATYVDDLLARCGFTNVLADRGDRYPRLEEPLTGPDPDVVLLPSEPYAFTDDDVGAVRRLVGADPRLAFVDGRRLTWHGPSTPEALATYGALARRLADAKDYS